MFRIFKLYDGNWYLIDDHQSGTPIGVYDDIKYLLEDLEFLLEGYNLKKGVYDE